MTQIESRHSPEALPDEALLPSQRALFSLEQPHKPHPWSTLSHTAVNQLGEFLAYDLSLIQDHDTIERGELRSEREHQRRIHELGILAHRLLRAGPHYDPYETFDRTQVTITDSMNVEAVVFNDFKTQDMSGRYGSYDSKTTVFTPQGFVHNPPKDFRQKIVALDIENKHTFAEDAVFHFDAHGSLYLYTDNLSAETPFWQFNDRPGISDIFPARRNEPYFFHAVPPRIVGEDLALSAVESIARIFATSNREHK